jgi:hypothetical protein
MVWEAIFFVRRQPDPILRSLLRLDDLKLIFNLILTSGMSFHSHVALGWCCVHYRCQRRRTDTYVCCSKTYCCPVDVFDVIIHIHKGWRLCCFTLNGTRPRQRSCRPRNED